MADINQAYGNIFDNNVSTVRTISYFFTQRKITESRDSLNPETLRRTKKNINFTQNYLAIVLPKDEKSPKLNVEIYGNNGYNYQGEIISYMESTPHLLLPLNNDKEIFVNIYDYIKKDIDPNDDNKEKLNNCKEKRTKYISFIHVPKRYQNITDIEDSSTIEDIKDKKTKTETKRLKVDI
jgi:hypothetical protein